GAGGARAPGAPGAAAGPGGPFGSDRSIGTAVSYVKQHGGGTIAVSSQSSAAAAIIGGDVQVAGIGGFSGRESEVSRAWLAQAVSTGKIRWVLVGQSGPGAGRSLPGDTRTGSRTAMAAVAQVCRGVTLPASASAAKSGGSASSAGSTATGSSGQRTTSSTLYDCSGRSAALAGSAAQAGA
ncbi:MAG: glycosyl transferase family 39, partial [Solirubrobacterales bacterium]|nr:glycosyl transferase family 39 [Solirubrobacterales bacterium]